MKLQGKTIVITGASSGIGRAMALRAAQDKCTVVIAARNIDKLSEVKEEIEKLGSTAIAVECDVTKDDDIRNLFLKATEGGRVLDVVFNNAGLGYINPLEDLKLEEIHKMIDVNTTGMIISTKFATEVMVRQKHGHIIMTSSIAGLLSLPQWTVYCATKWAITGFAAGLRPELKKYNIKITTLHPGTVATSFFDKDKANFDINLAGNPKDIITPEQVAEAVYDAIFTNKKKIIIPAIAKNYALFYKYLPDLVETQLVKIAGEIEYHKDIEEDEPEFDYIKEVKAD